MRTYTMRLLKLLLLLSVTLTQGNGLFAQNTLDLAGLDNTSPATVAYSLRKLSTSYAGFAIQVRRSNDNAIQNIGFGGNGDLDIAALTSFVGANNAFVTIWYDQSGNARNLTQGTASRQPWIVHSGVVDVENSRPFIRFYGHNGIDFDTDLLALSAEMTTTGHLVTVNKFASVAAGGAGFILGHTSIYDWHSQYPAGKLFHTSITSSSILNGLAWQNGIAVSPSLAVFNSSLMVNSIAPQSPSTSTRWNNIGSDRNGFHDVNLGGGYAELITFSTALASVARVSVEKNQASYFGITTGNYLERSGGLSSIASNQVNKFGRRGASSIGRNGETAPQNLPATPTTTNLALSSSTTANLTVTMSANDGSGTTAGICWGTSSNPTIAGTSTSVPVTGLSLTATMTSLTNGTTYYVRSYVTNALGTVYGNEMTFTHVSPGYAYQGGKVAYVYQPGDPGYVAGQVHGLIAASSDLGTTAIWGCAGINISGSEGIALGTGSANTASIIAQCGTAGIAARLCDNYLVTEGPSTYSDWFLPSMDELTQLFNNRVAIGGFSSNWFWSSSESISAPASSAQIRFFSSAGSVSPSYAKNTNVPRVRAVRYF